MNTTRRINQILAVGIVAGIAAGGLTGCSSGGDRPSQGARAIPAPIVLHESASGSTLRIRPGQSIEIDLDGLGWTFATDQPGLWLGGIRTTSVSSKCVPGGACGVVTASLTTADTGRAHITASRDYCGEDRRCTPDVSSFSVTVVSTQ